MAQRLALHPFMGCKIDVDLCYSSIVSCSQKEKKKTHIFIFRKSDLSVTEGRCRENVARKLILLSSSLTERIYTKVST